MAQMTFWWVGQAYQPITLNVQALTTKEVEAEHATLSVPKGYAQRTPLKPKIHMRT